jgi:hypothetical protein
MNDLTLICGKCRFPIRGASGCVYAPFAELRSPADEIRWRTSHYSCFPRGVRDHYEIGSERIATWQQMAWWTAHLMEKNWFPRSDWDELLRELSGDVQPRRIRIEAREAA